MHTPSHINVCKFFNFQLTFSQLANITPEMLNLCSFTKVNAFFLVLEFSGAILEKGFLKTVSTSIRAAQ